VLSIISLYSVLNPEGTWIYGTQDLFHFGISFEISFLSSILGTFDGSKWTELSTSSQQKLEESKKYVVIIWNLINFRGLANLGIGIYKLTNQLQGIRLKTFYFLVKSKNRRNFDMEKELS
jgi:hypothetical protein